MTNQNGKDGSSKSNDIYTVFLLLMYSSAIESEIIPVAMLSVPAFLSTGGGSGGSTFWDKFGSEIRNSESPFLIRF